MKTPEETEAFFQHTIHASVAITALASLFAIVYAGPGLASRYFIFSAWMLLNLFAWKFGLKEFLGKRRLMVLAPLLTIKVIWIAILFLICSKAGIGENYKNFTAFLLGINTPFLVAFLEAWGKVLTQDGNTPPCGPSFLRSQVAKKINSTDE